MNTNLKLSDIQYLAIRTKVLNNYSNIKILVSQSKQEADSPTLSNQLKIVISFSAGFAAIIILVLFFAIIYGVLKPFKAKHNYRKKDQLESYKITKEQSKSKDINKNKIIRDIKSISVELRTNEGTVCLQSFTEGDCLAVEECNHSFAHSIGIESWSKVGGSDQSLKGPLGYNARFILKQSKSEKATELIRNQRIFDSNRYIDHQILQLKSVRIQTDLNQSLTKVSIEF